MSENNETNKSKSDSSEANNDLTKTSDDNNHNNNTNQNSIELEMNLQSKKANVEKVLNESKENKSKPHKVESRYKQSAKEWSNKRNDDLVHNKSKDKSTKSENSSRSRNPTPNSKIRTTKASTPVSTNKSLNCSGVSVITVGNDFNCVNNTKNCELESNQNMKKYGKGLTTNRQSILPKREIKGESSRVPMSLFPSESQKTKETEIEKSINRSIYLKSVFLNLKAKQIKRERNTNAFNKITEIWNINNELRLKLQSIQNSVKSLENTFESIEILEKQKDLLHNHLEMRKLLDPLFSSFADLINKQKMILKIQNCSESDFEKLNVLLKSLPQLRQIESFEKLSEASVQTEELRAILDDIESLKDEFNKYALQFQQMIEEKQKLESTEKLIENKSLV